MGALPKRKLSKGRRDRRRSQDALKAPALSICPKCKKAKRPHFVCEYCGYYGPATKEENKATAKTETKK
ncbi:MAG: 50S ribosomal protein L32 [candidate division WS6 bacterium GW2011_GWF2_39_15]|uniref:Large ribosomal subunit protein bL32 n=1 Tax=candidate division WS6 bacterium GW2011_GWF2_39_15 TaxID=1619100 RepID=A0A0G0N066_9BACT|nr:MAG: 50S ribosomal protein L32 [candidate division WS6 bacterium GW2011_GWF2_39_15]